MDSANLPSVIEPRLFKNWVQRVDVQIFPRCVGVCTELKQQNQMHAAVTQLDRVLGYEPRSQEFESLQPRQVIIEGVC
jgi:hypothetical protein